MIRVGYLDARSYGRATRGHYIVDTETDFAYTMVRKNASSSWLKFLEHLSNESRPSGISRQAYVDMSFEMEARYASKCSSRILVVRDPIERIESLYANKFLNTSNNQRIPIREDVERILDVHWREVTYRDFVLHYLGSGLANDIHLTSQANRLGPIEYNCVVKISDLSNWSSRFFGPTVGRAFFGAPDNASTKRASVQRLTDSRIVSFLEDYYAKDYEMLAKVSWSGLT